MPAITRAESQKMLDAIDTMRGADRANALRLVGAMTPAGLCSALHAMRRWYSSNTSAVARRILEHVDALGFAMDLRLPVGVYRGFKVDTTSPLLDVIREGKTTTLEVTRNGGCSSWSIERDKVNRFSGASPGKVGIVVQLVGASPDAQTFIAPPMCSAPWFNELYEKTMGRSFRHSENEYAICAREVRVRIVAIKRK